MSHARLTSVEVTRFKSYRERTCLALKPLTVLVGRNNSGKSTMVQALLLLKQTLENPRTDVPLDLVGTVEALSLRELTHGWPESLDHQNAGPSFALELESQLDLKEALAGTVKTSEKVLIENGIQGLQHRGDATHADVWTRMELSFGSEGRRTHLTSVRILSRAERPEADVERRAGRPSFLEGLMASKRKLQRFYAGSFDVLLRRNPDGSFRVSINGETVDEIGIEWDHFIPHLTLDRSGLGPRDQKRIYHNLWLFRCQQPLADLRALLRGFGFLGSTRSLPPTLYRVSASEPPDTVGVSGEHAAEILHARRDDVVHYLCPVGLQDNRPSVEATVRARPLIDAVNDVFSSMGLAGQVSIDDVKDFGFRLLFGKATLQHVGRGLTYLLPLVEYGLLLDPKRFDGVPGDVDHQTFLDSLTGYSLAALEEPEAHIHPKLQTQLAHWFVSLAMCGRNLIVETHSDHFVRRLRGLIARAPQGGSLETWLRENVAIVEVSQDAGGCSTLAASGLTERGDFERWPADFMDVATDEEREIYDAALEKPAVAPGPTAASGILHDHGEEPLQRSVSWVCSKMCS